MTTEKTTKTAGFSDAERAAMKERAAELRAQKGGRKKANGLEDLLASIEKMPDEDRVLAERIHAIVTDVAPELEAKTWYGQPAWAKDGKVVCFFHSAAKYETRYATFGFNDVEEIESGSMWPTSFSLTAIGDAEAKEIAALVRKLVD